MNTMWYLDFFRVVLSEFVIFPLAEDRFEQR